VGLCKSHVFYLIPEEQFQRHHYTLRTIEPTLAKTSNRELAFANSMARDAAYHLWLRHECATFALPLLVVDGSQSLEQTILMIGAHSQQKHIGA